MGEASGKRFVQSHLFLRDRRRKSTAAKLIVGHFGLTRTLVLKLALPHIMLITMSVVYILVGATVLTNITAQAVQNSTHDAIKLQEIKDKFADELYESKRIFGNDEQDGIYEDVYLKFAKDVQDYHQTYRNLQKRQGFAWKTFFATNALASIGYGSQAPSTFLSRLFMLFYIFFGLPLILVTVADLAKFLSTTISKSYIEFKCSIENNKERFKKFKENLFKKKEEANNSAAVENIEIAGEDKEVAEFLWANLENCQIVQVPFLLAYSLLIGYIGFGAIIYSQAENWSLINSFYFCVISMLTVGFGDFVPQSSSFLPFTVVYIVLGLILTTACVEMMSQDLLENLHNVGRRLESSDPMYWLKKAQEAKMRNMKSSAIKTMLQTATLLRHIDIKPKAQDNGHVPAEPETLPPARRLRAANAAAESICLKWDQPDFSYVERPDHFWYTLTYHRREFRKNKVVDVNVIDNLTSQECQVTGLRAFTLYEFAVKVSASNYKCSDSIHIEEFTEPSTVPQNVRVKLLPSCEEAQVDWQEPKTNKENRDQQFSVHWDPVPARAFNEWQSLDAQDLLTATLHQLMPNTNYVLAVSAKHNAGQAIVSKHVHFKTSHCKDTWKKVQTLNTAVNNMSPAQDEQAGPPDDSLKDEAL